MQEINPALPSIDSEAIAQARHYGAQDANAALDSFEVARAETVALITGLSAEQFNRTADFEGYGALTLRSLMHYLCSHDQQHLAGLQWLLGKIEASHA